MEKSGKKKLIISELAEEDLRDAKSYYESKRTGLGEELVEEVEITLNNIVANPKQFPIVKKDIRKGLVNRFPFAIYFVFKNYIINVLSIFHASRNPTVWKKRNE
jgi:plasmid stabilization system protein ParE